MVCPQLSTELWIDILRHLKRPLPSPKAEACWGDLHQHDLTYAMRVNSTFHDIAAKYLYEDVVVERVDLLLRGVKSERDLNRKPDSGKRVSGASRRMNKNQLLAKVKCLRLKSPAIHITYTALLTADKWPVGGETDNWVALELKSAKVRRARKYDLCWRQLLGFGQIVGPREGASWYFPNVDRMVLGLHVEESEVRFYATTPVDLMGSMNHSVALGTLYRAVDQIMPKFLCSHSPFDLHRVNSFEITDGVGFDALPHFITHVCHGLERITGVLGVKNSIYLEASRFLPAISRKDVAMSFTDMMTEIMDSEEHAPILLHQSAFEIFGLRFATCHHLETSVTKQSSIRHIDPVTGRSYLTISEAPNIRCRTWFALMEESLIWPEWDIAYTLAPKNITPPCPACGFSQDYPWCG